VPSLGRIPARTGFGPCAMGCRREREERPGKAKVLTSGAQIEHAHRGPSTS